MIGDRMAGTVVAISRELPPRTSSVFMPKGAEEPTGGSQSVRSSDEGRETVWSEGTQESGRVKDPKHEAKPAPVGNTGASTDFPKRAGETQDEMAWVERSMWTERMLKRLATSQEQTKWYSLWDKVCSPENLDQAIFKVILNGGSPGVDGYPTQQLHAQWKQQRDQLRQELMGGTYRPKPARRVWIPKLGSAELRPLGIPAVRDRVVQTALRAVLEPIFEREFAAQSHGFRPQHSAMDALQQVENLLQAGYIWVVDADLKQYFDTIPHGRLMKLIKGRVTDGKVIRLLEQYLAAGVMESHKGWKPTWKAHLKEQSSVRC